MSEQGNRASTMAPYDQYEVSRPPPPPPPPPPGFPAPPRHTLHMLLSFDWLVLKERISLSFPLFFQVAVPIEVAGSCLMEVAAEIYSDAGLWEGFRTPALIRFVTGEDAYLSPSHGGAVMYANLEDYISISAKKENTK